MGEFDVAIEDIFANGKAVQEVPEPEGQYVRADIANISSHNGTR